MLFKRRADRSGIHRVALMEPNQDFVRGILQPGGGLVQLASRLGGKLAKLVAIPDMGQSPKYQVRTHQFILLIVDRVRGSRNPAYQKPSAAKTVFFLYHL